MELAKQNGSRRVATSQQIMRHDIKLEHHQSDFFHVHMTPSVTNIYFPFRLINKWTVNL
jgi:hypothetical protein